MSELTQTKPDELLREGVLGSMTIVFFVIATNGPLIGLVGAVPGAIIFGNGIGVAGTFLLAGLVYLLFSIGFTAMSRHVTNAGAFYAYVTSGLGRPLGITAAFLAIAAYIGIQIVCYAMVGFFLSQAEFDHLALDFPWWANALAVALVVCACGYRNINFSGKLLGLLMLCEMAIILVFDLAVIAKGGGPEGFSSTPFHFSSVFSNGLGAALVYIIGSYFGFETTAIYAEEAKDPKRTVARATYIALLVITLFFAISVWAVIMAHGPHQAVADAKANQGTFWFGVAASFVSPLAADAMSWLMITSVFAALVSLHNSVSRYFFALGRERVLWHVLARTHRVQQSPYIASACQTVFAISCIGILALAGAQPMESVVPLAATISSAAILIVQILTSLAVIGFFRRHALQANPIEALFAPTASALSLSALLYLIFASIPLLEGDSSLAETLIPLLIVAIAATGLLYSFWLRSRRPERYAAIGRLLVEM